MGFILYTLNDICALYFVLRMMVYIVWYVLYTL